MSWVAPFYTTIKISENTLLSLTKAIKSLKLWKILGRKLLKSANFSPKDERIIKATVSELKYVDKAQQCQTNILKRKWNIKQWIWWTNIKTDPTFYSQNEPRSDNENEYFENESNAYSTESSKTYFTPKSKAQKERHPDNRRLVRLKSPQWLQEEYNRSCSRNWCSDYQQINSQNH